MLLLLSAFGAMWKGAPDPYGIYVDYATEGPKIKELVRRGHGNGVKIIMSIGGWYGSQTFSEVAADPVKRRKWIESAMVFLRPNTLGDNATIPNGWNMDVSTDLGSRFFFWRWGRGKDNMDPMDY